MNTFYLVGNRNWYVLSEERLFRERINLICLWMIIWHYLRSSMVNDRLSDLRVLNVNIEMKKDLDKDRIIDEFAEGNKRRIVLQ